MFKGTKVVPAQIENKSQKSVRKIKSGELCPCLCEAVSPILLWARLTGILPTKSTNKDKHKMSCRFEVSTGWTIYSFVLQLIYLIYFFAAYGFRISCNHRDSGEPDWYVMTIGYMISDFNNLITLIYGIISAKECCKILNELSAINETIEGMRRFQRNSSIVVKSILAYFGFLFLSYVYVSVLRYKYSRSVVFGCHSLDDTFAVILRGATLIFPTVQITLVYMFTFLLCKKFDDLAESTSVTMVNLTLSYSEENIFILDCSAKKSQNLPRNNFQLTTLAQSHQKIFHILEKVNKCLGLQLLTSVSTSLYSAIYYLFRYCTAFQEKTMTSSQEKLHYMLGVGFRLSQTIAYMMFGQKLYDKSMEPRRVLRRDPKIINLPTQIQNQIQTLMIQWNQEEGYLSAWGVFRMGPWLLAPIVGNVVTYLLVALQFDISVKSSEISMTAIVEALN